MLKRIEVEIELLGDGTVRQTRPGTFVGGVPDPDRAGLTFSVYRERGDKRPVPFEGTLQLDIKGTPDGYRDAARYLLALAELDTMADPDFHDHQDGFVSEDGRATVNLVLRRSAPGL